MDVDWVIARLAGEGSPLIIDGGMGTELEKNGVPMNGACWSGMAVLEAPDAVRKVHTDFIRAGAEVVITNTFGSGRHMLDPADAAEHVESINLNAVRLVREAIEDAATGPVAVAGSMCEWSWGKDGPKWSQPHLVGEALNEQAQLLAEGGVDLIAIEMAQDTELALLAVDAAVATGLPFWVGLSARRVQGSNELTTFDDPDEGFRKHAHAMIAHAKDKGMSLVNIMHTPVPDVPEALDIVAEVWDGPTGVYPESGFFQMPNWQFVDVISPEDLVSEATFWVSDRRVRLLGGCCGLGPEHIAALRTAFP